MNISKHNMISPGEILSDVLKQCNDESFKDNSRGYYTSLIQQALQELAFDTFFDERTETLAVPGNLNVEMPKGAFNIRQLYLYNGTECNIENSQNIYWKRNYYTKGNGYLARDKGFNNNDPFYNNRTVGRHDDANLRRVNSTHSSITQSYFYNVQNGIIMLSQSCKRFENIAIVFNGTGADIGDVPFIPQLYREAIKMWVLDSALKVKMATATPAEFNRWQTLWSINDKLLRKPYTGAWEEAQVRAKSIDAKQREDLKEYLGRLNY